MKTLLTEKSIKDLIAQGGHSVCIDENTIVTPAARDAIKYNGLEVTDMDPMTYAMLQYLPIRTLRSFTHMTNERVESIVAALKEEVEKVSR